MAANADIPIEPKYETGSTAFNYEKTGEEKFLPLAAKSLSSALPSQSPYLYGPTAWTAAGSKYPLGDLFPFKAKWTVYAGDCAANNTGAEAVAETVQVKSGETANVKVPTSYTKLSIWNGESPDKHEEADEQTLRPGQDHEHRMRIGGHAAERHGHASSRTNRKKRCPKAGSKSPTSRSAKTSSSASSTAKPKRPTRSRSPTRPPPAPRRTSTSASARTPKSRSDLATAESTMKANEPYKEKGGYSNKTNEAKVEKEKYEEWLAKYNADKGKYKPKPNYTT